MEDVEQRTVTKEGNRESEAAFDGEFQTEFDGARSSVSFRIIPTANGASLRHYSGRSRFSSEFAFSFPNSLHRLIESWNWNNTLSFFFFEFFLVEYDANLHQ